MLIVFNGVFNNISAISWRSVILEEETGEKPRPAASHLQILSHNVASSTLRSPELVVKEHPRTNTMHICSSNYTH